MRFKSKYNLHDIAGPSISMPRAIFCVTSSELDPLSASFASIPAFDKSINNKKKNSASLCNTKRKKSQCYATSSNHKRDPIIITTYFKSDMSLSKKFIILDVKMKLENTVNKPAMPVERENCVNISYLTLRLRNFSFIFLYMKIFVNIK